ncbi:MAG: primary-amine oxidase [Microbacterium sp.]|jgi:primary-amine oxidase|uniref:primary-amine oxidase n=1 Tax=Microbacterium sp. TaxID=51671 RepID=UPI002829EF3C|nr:primary-amine oxidase [Microbacterium sp.]MDR2321559.1 primary-amine oxidase [Microbacterium sp.]
MSSQPTPSHPLDSLTGAEFSATAAVLTREHGIDAGWRYASIILKEPPKAEVKAWREGDPVVRRSLSVLWRKQTNEVYEAVVNLTDDTVESWTHVPGVTPNFTIDEYHDCDHAMKENPEVRAALADRGIDDLDLVLFDVWTYGGAVIPDRWRDRRLGWVDLWMRATPDGNPYAHPVSGLKIIVDMNTLEVLEIEDHHDFGFPEVRGEYVPELAGITPREDLKPLQIVQPEGVSFTVEGSRVRWQNWDFRLGFNYREGPVIYQVGFDDQGTRREVAYRLSFAEMIVPYRDSSFDHYRRTAFDIGEWGLGYMCTSLELGCDCLGEITYLDAVLPDTAGQPWTITNAICLHEEDNAVLWKHVDPDAGTEVRRQRRFVVSVHATVANYEYLVYWRFYQDGNIECEVRATGIMVTTPMAEGEQGKATGTTIDARTYAPFHQHFLIARLDLDVDGDGNTVVESDSMPAPISETNPFGLDLHTQATVIRSEAEAGRRYDWERQRGWKVQNPNRLNAWGAPVAYKLVPSASFPAMFDESSPILKRNPVIGKTLWVTRHHDDQFWPAGDYPTQAVDDLGNGMTAWIADDENLVDEDVVLWYNFGIHHITRAEDWPIMPADTISFWLKPFGFFDRNPSLDAPRTVKGAACACGGGECHCDHGAGHGGGAAHGDTHARDEGHEHDHHG